MKYRNGIFAGILFLSGLYLTQERADILYIVYTATILVLLYVATRKSSSIFLSFLTALFLLGNWIKITIHGIFQYDYVEATGAFDGSVEQWDRFFLFSISITLALTTAIIAVQNAPRKKPKLKNVRETVSDIQQMNIRINSRLYNRLAVLFIIIIYFLNWKFGFYRIGVGRELNLPLGLNAPASFLVYLGAPMLTSIVAMNSVARAGKVTIKSLLFVSLVSVLAAITTYSRASTAIILLPIVLGMYKASYVINGRRQSVVPFLLLMIPTLLITLSLVSLTRIFAFGGVSAVDPSMIQHYLEESMGLFVDRWIGAEGLMVAVSSSQSVDLFLRILFENPSAGVNSLYQVLSNSQYQNTFFVNMTFLTLPGAFAILAFSGSLLLVFLGVLLISLLGVFVEQQAIQLYKNYFSLQYLISASFAYHFSQMVFPVLLVPFILQTSFFLLLFYFFFHKTLKSDRKSTRQVS